MGSGVGLLTKLQIAAESEAAYGTRVATGMTSLEVDAWKCDLEQGIRRSRALYAGLGSRAIYPTGYRYEGRAGGEWRYEGMLKVLAAAVGKIVVPTGSVAAGYSYAFKVDKTAAGGVSSICAEVDEGGVYETGGDCSLVLGLVIPRMKWTIRAGDTDDALLLFECDVLAKDKIPQTTAQFTAGVPAATQIPVYHGEVTALKDGTANVTGQNVVRMEIEIANPLARRMFLGNSRAIYQPLRNGDPVVTWSVVQEFTDYKAFKAARDQTVGELQVQFTSATDIPGATGGTKYMLDFNSKTCKAVNAPQLDWNDKGILEVTTTWESYFDPATSSLLLVTPKVSKATVGTAGA